MPYQHQCEQQMSQLDNYKGRYFNEYSTRAQSVTVVLNAGTIVISQPEVWDQHKHWEIKKLVSIDREKNKVILKYGPPEHLEILEVNSYAFFQYLKSEKQLPKIKTASSPLKYIIVSVLFLLITGCILIYLFVFPWLIKTATDAFPKETEIEMGKTMLKGFLANEKTDVNGTALLNKFYATSGIAADYKMHFTLVKSPTVNAFALPGGEVVVYTGIVEKMNHYEELAALIGHETGHVQKRHSLKLLVKQSSMGLIIGTLLQTNDLAAFVIQQAAELHKLSYSRESEEEADQFAYETMQATNINPQGMVDLFKHMQAERRDSQQIPEFLMTHPTIGHRIAAIEKRIKKHPGMYAENGQLKLIWENIQKHIPDTTNNF